MVYATIDVLVLDALRHLQTVERNSRLRQYTSWIYHYKRWAAKMLMQFYNMLPQEYMLKRVDEIGHYIQDKKKKKKWDQEVDVPRSHVWLHGPRVTTSRLRAYVKYMVREMKLDAESSKEGNNATGTQPVQSTTVHSLLGCIKACQMAARVKATIYRETELSIMQPGETSLNDKVLATASGGENRGPFLALDAATQAEAIATAGGAAASPADVSIKDGVTGVTDTLLAADGSRFLRLSSAFSASSSGDGASGSSNSSSAYGGPGVAQALCALKPAAPTSNVSQEAQHQQAPRQLSLSFFARASLCTEGEGRAEGAAEGEAERLLKVLLLAVPLNASAAAAAGGGGAAGGAAAAAGGAEEGGAGAQVWGEWQVGVPCGKSIASLSGALPWACGGSQQPRTLGLIRAAGAGETEAEAAAPAVQAAGGMAVGGAVSVSPNVAVAAKGVGERPLSQTAPAAEGVGGRPAQAAEGGAGAVTPSEAVAAVQASGGMASSGAGPSSHTAAPAAEGVRERPPLAPAASGVAGNAGGAGGAGGVGGAGVAESASPRRVGVASEAGSMAVDLVSVMSTRSESQREQANPSPLKSFTHWPLSSSHPLLTAGSTRRNRSSLSLTTLSDLNAAALALHPTPFALLAPATPSSPCRPFSFSTSFSFRISSPNAAGLGGEGLAFVMLPSPTLGLPGPSLGYGRLLLPPGSTTGADNASGVSSQVCVISKYVSSQHRSLAVEFDTASSPEFFDRPDHHVGVNLHGSMLSLASAPVHPLGIPSLNAGQTLLATIHYNASSSLLTVWLSPAPSSSASSSSRSSASPTSSSRSLGFPRFLRFPRPSRSSSFSSSSASSHSAPPLPRSAVLTTFLDTCEWLGGNDPEAAAPHPLLFVGFTAATGKGAEKAQAHEVLGWTFQVGEAAEDPLPFWAADSFSFPYIMPATPLLTRGSTRRRFFAADLSVAADVASSTGTGQSDEPAPGALFFPRRRGGRGGVDKGGEGKGGEGNGGEGNGGEGHGGKGNGGKGYGGKGYGGKGYGGKGGSGSKRLPSCCLVLNTLSHPLALLSHPLALLSHPLALLHNPSHPLGIPVRFPMSPFSSCLPHTSAPHTPHSHPPSPWTDTNPCNASPVLPCGTGVCTTFETSQKLHQGTCPVYPPRASHPLSPHLTLHLPHTLHPPSPTDTDPCKGSPVLPCGTGVCTKAPAPWDPSVLLPSCKCPFNLPSFEPTHLAGLPSCFPGETWNSFTCRQLASNPCAPGVCIDEMDGTYSCLCPSDFPTPPFSTSPHQRPSRVASSPPTHVPRGHCSLPPLCIPPALACLLPYHLPLPSKGDVGRFLYSLPLPLTFLPPGLPLKATARCHLLPIFLSPYGLTCPLILSAYGLTETEFFLQNKGFKCRAPIPVNTIVNVTSRAFSPCTAMYSASYGDTCDSLNALFSTQIQPLNPALSCSDGPRPGQLLCVDFNHTWLELGKTHLECNHYAQITPTATTTPSPPTPAGIQPPKSKSQGAAMTEPILQPPPLVANYASQGMLVTERGPQPPPLLANYTSQGVLVTVLQGPQSCQQLWRAFAISSPTRFFQMNPGVSCDSLLPHSPLQGNMMSKGHAPATQPPAGQHDESGELGQDVFENS
ncbi:unnamed protein product [Closterium sp. NIES-65]|nr:unnamed protein product [Closterium sp. NIES-65]